MPELSIVSSQPLTIASSQPLAEAGDQRGFWESLGDKLNPIPAMREWMSRPDSVRSNMDSLHVLNQIHNEAALDPANKGLPVNKWKLRQPTADEQTIIEKGMNTALPGAEGNALTEAAGPGVEAAGQVGAGNYAGAAGTLAGGYAVPAALTAAAEPAIPIAKGAAKGFYNGSKEMGSVHLPLTKGPIRAPKAVIGGITGAGIGKYLGGETGEQIGAAAGALAPGISEAYRGAKQGYREYRNSQPGVARTPGPGQVSTLPPPPSLDVPAQTAFPSGRVPGRFNPNAPDVAATPADTPKPLQAVLDDMAKAGFTFKRNKAGQVMTDRSGKPLVVRANDLPAPPVAATSAAPSAATSSPVNPIAQPQLSAGPETPVSTIPAPPPLNPSAQLVSNLSHPIVGDSTHAAIDHSAHEAARRVGAVTEPYRKAGMTNWANNIANSLKIHGITPEQLDGMSVEQIDQHIKDAGLSTSAASKRSPESIAQMKSRLRELWSQSALPPPPPAPPAQ